jgi:hypothetical protein
MVAMFNPDMELLLTACQQTLAALERGDAGDAWAPAREAVAKGEAIEPELAAAVASADAEALRTLVDEWLSGRRLMAIHDRNVLRRAMRAFRKSLKVTRLDDESKVGGSPMSGGRESKVVGIVPPPRYPRAVWNELARQRRLIENRGTFELPPGG